MLYFIKSLNYLKIGYTKDENTYNKRLSTYKTHNPNFKILDVVKEGDVNDEIKLHHLLKQYSYYTEWFYDCPEVYEIWEEYTKNMPKYIPEQKRKENIIKLKKSFITNKTKKIEEDIDKIFNKENCIMSGNEIKEKMSEIYSYYGVKFYSNIKTLEKYGYLLTRFLDIDAFKYKIEKI